ncbi:Protein of unknown function [Gryllus bimaculatus]
MEYVC